MTELPDPQQFGDYGEWPGRAVLDANGDRLGEVREIYLDDATDRPEWVLIERGDREPRFVPLADAKVENEAIRVAHATDRIEAAPSFEPTKQLTLDQERDLYSHYSVQLSEQASDSILPATGDEAARGDADTATQPAVPESRDADTTAEPAAADDTAADAPAAGGEPVAGPSAGTPAVTGGGTPGTWSSAAAPPEGEGSVLAGDQDAAVTGGPEAGDPAATAGTSEAGGPDAAAAGVSAAAGLAGGADVVTGTGAGAPPAPEDAPKLPPPGETSEPEDRGPMVPPRPEPVAPPPPPPPPPPDSGGPLAVVTKKPVPIIGGVALLALIILIIRRRS